MLLKTMDVFMTDYVYVSVCGYLWLWVYVCMMPNSYYRVLDMDKGTIASCTHSQVRSLMSTTSSVCIQ